VDTEEITDLVATAPNSRVAQSNYQSYVGQYSGFPHEAALRVPRYGDEESANWASYVNSDGARRARAALVVLKGTVVWALLVENCGVLSPFGCFFGSTPSEITEARAVVELEKFAIKLEHRVGNA
jgi:hypothetical protein